MSTELTPFDLQVLNTAQLSRAKLVWTQTMLDVPGLGRFLRSGDKMQIQDADRPSQWVRALSPEGSRQLAELHDSLLSDVVDHDARNAEITERAKLINQLAKLSGSVLTAPGQWDHYSLEDLRGFLKQAQTSVSLAQMRNIAGNSYRLGGRMSQLDSQLDAAVYRQQVLRNMELAANPAVVATPEPPTVEPVTLPKGHLLSRLLGR